MITIPDKSFTSDINLEDIYYTMTKKEMLDICNKLDLYVSPNVSKDKTASRLADEVLGEPINVLHQLCKNELQLLDEFVKAGADKYIVRPIRQTHYKLQKYGLVVTYIAKDENKWYMLMPNSVRESLAPLYETYLQMAEAGKKMPSPKELRLMAALRNMFGNIEQ